MADRAAPAADNFVVAVFVMAQGIVAGTAFGNRLAARVFRGSTVARLPFPARPNVPAKPRKRPMDAKHTLARTLDLTHRPRRNRRTDWSRRLVREMSSPPTT